MRSPRPTGTVQLKAVFPNHEHRLWPGQLVNARLLLESQKDRSTVAGSAVQQGRTAAYVYVVGQRPDGGLASRHVAQISRGQGPDRSRA